MSRDKYDVSRIETEIDLAELKEEWNGLVADIPDAHLFHTWEWLSMWWRHHKEDGELWLLIARDTNNGALAGILPLMLVPRRFGPLRVRMLTFMFYRPPIHQAVIAPVEERERVELVFIDYLYAHSKAWDVLTLDGFLTNGTATKQLQSAPGQYYERDAAICHVAKLPDDWDTFQMEHLSSNRRQQIRRARRKLENDHPNQFTFEQLTDAQDVQEALEILIELNRHRWHEEGIRSSFDERRFVEFHREMVMLALERDWLRFYQLKIADEIASLRYCFRYRDLLYDYQLTFNLDLGEYRPGELLLAHVLTEAMQEGVREFDMLRGTYRYKRSWSTDTRYEKHLLASTSLRGHIWLTGARLADKAKDQGREVLPKEVRERLNRLVSAAKQHTVQTSG